MDLVHSKSSFVLLLQMSVGAKPGPATMSAWWRWTISLMPPWVISGFLSWKFTILTSPRPTAYDSVHIHRKVASLCSKAVWDEEFTTSLGSLFQWSVIPTVKNSYFISSPTTSSFAFQSLDLFLSLSALLKSLCTQSIPLHQFSQTMIKSPLKNQINKTDHVPFVSHWEWFLALG